MKIRRYFVVAALGAAAAIAPLVPAAGVQVIDLTGPTAPDVPDAPSLPDCSESYTNACMSTTRDSAGRQVHKICVRDDVAADLLWSWTSSELLCIETEHFAYLPGPGVCLGSDRVQKPTACVNGNDCTLWVMGAWVLCDEVP